MKLTVNHFYYNNEIDSERLCKGFKLLINPYVNGPSINSSNRNEKA